jgi:diguanylate cyclase (GGDEF)-like protein
MSDDDTKSLPRVQKPPLAAGRRHAYLVNIYPTGPNMGARYVLGDSEVVLGRDSKCDILLQDESVSRRHAVIRPERDGHVVLDLKSRNGTFVNDKAVQVYPLRDGDYLRIGNGIYRYLAGDNLELQYHEEIYRLTIIDALTEIHNKRYFLDFLATQLSCAARYGRPLALVMFDIDRFKAINDRLGHLGGDHILRELAACVRKGGRRSDLFARYGGEEFALVLPETLHAGAMEMAEHVRQRVEAHPFEYSGNRVAVTVSLGVAAVHGGDIPSVEEFVRRADDNLYQAKNSGRNRVVG